MYSFDNLKDLFKNNKKYSFKDLLKIFKIKSIDDQKMLLNDLDVLEQEGIIININNSYSEFPKDSHILTNIKLFDQEGFFYFKDLKYTIHHDDLYGALENDLCLIIYDNDTQKAKVKKVVKRHNNLLVCEKVNDEISIYGKYKDHIITLNTTSIPNNSRFLVRIDNTFKDGSLQGKLIEVIGMINEPDIDLKTIALSKGFNISFSKDYLEELNNIKTKIDENDIIDRLDLRDKLIYTIDCDNTKDMDDAISVEINEKGNFILGVHIADLSHYVKFNSELFKEAYKRGTSVYMIDSVIPMFHQNLSNDICSLNPNVDRLTISCIIEIDKNGNIIDYNICKSIINSKMKMKYSEVNKILEENINIPEYEPFIDNLKLANMLNSILNKLRHNNGLIEFNDNDLNVATDEFGKALDFKINKQKTAEKIIENFMIIANEVVANHYSWCPFLYRIHDIPDEERIQNALNFLRVIGYKVPSLKNVNNPKTIQNLLKKLSNDDNFPIISNIVLRGMQKAIYSKENIGHFGLAISTYTHFTSPIRRLSDLIIHILISLYSDPKFFEHTDINSLEKFLLDASIQASSKERLADEAEKEANLMKMAEYMEDHIDEYFNGVIIDIKKTGITVETTNHIIGEVLFSDIKNDFYQFDPNTFSMIGKRSKKTLKIGDCVRIKVKDASKENRTIHFQIIEKINSKEKIKVKKL